VRIFFVGLQIVIIATLALAALVAIERSWVLAASVFVAGGVRVFALRCVSLGLRFWPKTIYAADLLFAGPLLALLALDLAAGRRSQEMGTALGLLVLPALSAGLCARLAPRRT
jgi:hypothetical protein